MARRASRTAAGTSWNGRSATARRRGLSAQTLRGEVVVGAGVGRRVVGLDDAGHAEAAGREQDRDVDPLAVHVAEAGRDVVVFHPA